jgi:putative membrane protein
MIHTLTQDERARIDAAKVAVEKRTAAEFTVVVTHASDRYPLVDLVWAALGALAIAAVAALIWPDLDIVDALTIQVPALIVLAVLFDWMPVRLFLVPKRTKNARAHQLAHREFASHIIGGGAHRNRVLLFVSLGERYVEILADRGTHALVPEGTWDKIVAEFVGSVRAGHVADGILGAIAACGKVLETHHPKTGD